MSAKPVFAQPTLSITKQDSLAKDTISVSGQKRDLHIVAKNVPFTLHVLSSANLNSSPLTAKLFFDRQGEEKEVEALKASPVEYTAHIDETGHRAVLEVRVNVLSSQHEGVNFFIRIRTVDNGRPLETVTNPMRVISKRRQAVKIVQRKQEKQQAAATGANLPLSGTKRPLSEVISETLTRLEQSQREQASLIRQIHAQQKSQLPFCPSSSSDLDFESAFKAFVSSYQRIPSEERALKVRRVVEDMDGTESAMLVDLVSVYTGQLGQQDATPYSAVADDITSSPYTDTSSPVGSDDFSDPTYSPSDNFDAMYRNLVSGV